MTSIEIAFPHFCTIFPLAKHIPKNHNIKDGNKVYTSGKEGIFSPGIPMGEVKIDAETIMVQLFSDLNQITFINIAENVIGNEN